MPLSGSFYKYPVNNFGLYCEWSATQSTVGYYSDVTIGVFVRCYSLIAAKKTCTIACGGEVYEYTSHAIKKSENTLSSIYLGSHTFRVYHDQGDKEVSVSASWPFYGTYSGITVSEIVATSRITLDAIPQQSIISSLSVDANNKVTISLNRYNSNFTHSIKFMFGTYSQTVAESGTSHSFTIPREWLKTIPDRVTGTGSVQVTTLSGGSQIGSAVSKDFEVTVPKDVVPSIGGIAWTKTSSEPSSWPITKGVSQGTMSMTGVQGIYGSTIVSYSLTFAGLSSNAATLTVSGVHYSGILKAIAKVTDSRGRSNSKEVEFTVADYSKPRLTVTAYRCNNSGVEDASGECFFIRAIAEVTPIGNNLNTLDTLMLYYKRKNDSSYNELELTSGDENILLASSDSTWEWRVVAGDWVNSVDVVGVVPTGQVVLDILANGKGIKFGGVAEQEGFDLAWPLMFDGVKQVDFVVAWGKSDIWEYRKWFSGRVECWGKWAVGMYIKNSWGSIYYNKVDAYSFPSGLFLDAPRCQVTIECRENTEWAWLATAGETTKDHTPDVLFCSPVKLETASGFSVLYYAIGKWK